MSTTIASAFLLFSLFVRIALIDDGRRDNSNRYSLASNSDQFHPPSGVDSSTIESASAGGYASPPRTRHDSNALLMLPTPLAVSRHTTASASSGSNAMSSTASMARSSEEGFDPGSSAHHLIPTAQTAVVDHWNDTSAYETPVRAAVSPPPRPPREHYRASMDTPPGSANPFITGNSPVISGSPSPVMYDEPEAVSPMMRNGAGVGAGGGGRGVRLTDSGPVPGPEGGVRRVARQSARRPTSQAPVGAGGQGQGSPQQQQPNRYSRNSMGFSLPPGAAAPQPGYPY